MPHGIKMYFYILSKYDSAYIFVSNLNYGMNEGDIVIVFSEFGEVVDIRLARDK